MNDKTVVKVTGPSFLTLLTIVFIVLKLCNVITWSWIGVLAPLWIPVALVLAILFIMFITAMIMAVIEKIKED